jgi:hypothetical protein
MMKKKKDIKSKSSKVYKPQNENEAKPTFLDWIETFDLVHPS